MFVCVIFAILVCAFFVISVYEKIRDLPLELADHLCIQHNGALFMFRDVVSVKKRICSSISHHIDISASNKKPIKNLLVLKLTRFHVIFISRNFTAVA